MSRYIFAIPKKRRAVRVTWTTQIMELLCRQDDLVSTSDIVAAVKCTTHQALVTLFHMRKHKAVDMMTDGGRTWWFATPNDDCRHHCIEERAEEEPGSRITRRRIRKLGK